MDDLLNEARDFLAAGQPRYELPPVVARLAWARQDRATVVAQMERERMRYQVYMAVGNQAAMQQSEKIVAGLLMDLKAWDDIIAELEAETHETGGNKNG